MKKTNSRRVNRSKQNRRWLWIGAAVAVAIVVIIVGLVLLGGDEDEKENSVSPTGLAREISVQEAAALRDQGAFMLDVREPNEWAEYHMPGATFIPLGELENRLSEVPRDQTVVVVCRSGNRSADGRDILLDAGYAEVTSMDGGMKAWRDLGLPTETGS